MYISIMWLWLITLVILGDLHDLLKSTGMDKKKRSSRNHISEKDLKSMSDKNVNVQVCGRFVINFVVSCQLWNSVFKRKLFDFISN